MIVEDELIAAENLREILEENGYRVVGVTDRGHDAVEMAKREQPDVIFMDIMLKDNLSGSEAAVMISRECASKIIFVTAYTEEEMFDYARISGSAGYLVKPYNKKQILATLRLLQESTPAEPTQHVMLCCGYVFDRKAQQLLNNGETVRLSPKARLLFTLLCKTPGTPLSCEQIRMQIWENPVDPAALRALVYRIRVSLDAKLIENVNGVGYKIITATAR